MTRTAKLLLVPVALLQLPFFTFLARRRFIDGDESSFLLVSRQVLMHRKPYLDFFYNQTPLLPYAYALWMNFCGMSWNSARMFSVVLTTLLGVLLYGHICQQTRNWLAGLAAIILFASSTLVFAWFPVVKTFPLAGLFLFSAYVVVSQISAESSPWSMAAAGLLLGLSVDTRSYLLLVTPLFAWWIFQNANTRRASVLWFLGGFMAGVAPSILLFASSPDVFLFDNVGYHAIRSSQGLIGWWQEKIVVVLQLFLGAPESNGLQWSILFFVSLGFVFSIPRRRSAPRFAFQIALVLIIISLLPTPTLPQYFCFCLPFLVVSAVCVVHDLLMSLESRRGRRLAAAACVALLALYVGASAHDFRRYLITGDGVPGVQPAQDRSDWRLQRVIEVSQAIDQIAAPGETVASFWAGDIFQTKATPLPGLENDFGLLISEKLTPRQGAKYRILLPDEIQANFAAHRPRIVVLRDQISPAATAEDRQRMQRLAGIFRSSLRAHGYTVVRRIGDRSIYVCCSNP
jgi:hypothetical protein